jgi:hypothetical protein
MQSALNPRKNLPLFGRLRHAGARPHVQAGVAELWAESLRVLAQHSPGILLFTFLAFSLPIVIGSLAGGYVAWLGPLRPPTTQSTSGIPTSVASTFISASSLAWWWKWGLQAALSVLIVPFARGVITWLALNHGNVETRVSTLRACVETLKRLPTLLFTVLTYGSVITVGAYGMMTLFRELRIDPSNIGLTRVPASQQQIWRTVSVRMLDNLIPNPGSPFSDALGYLRLELRRSSTTSSFSATAADFGDVTATAWIIGIVAALALLLGESFFRMRINAVMDAQRPHLLTGLVDSFRLGVRYFGRLTLHITTLRLVQFLATALFITLPLTLAQAFIGPRAFTYFNNNNATGLVLLFLLEALASPVIMLFVAFVSVYDARLYLRLKK